MDHTWLKTPIGAAFIEGDSQGISRISIHKKGSRIRGKDPPAALKACIEQLSAYFTKGLEDFDLKLNPQGTVFQKEVWQALRSIPYGRTLSYLQLARKIGTPKAVRAVAAANGKNPLWIVVPCHRVIGTDGTLTGYAGGIWRKRWLLEHEKALEQQTLF